MPKLSKPKKKYIEVTFWKIVKDFPEETYDSIVKYLAKFFGVSQKEIRDIVGEVYLGNPKYGISVGESIRRKVIRFLDQEEPGEVIEAIIDEIYRDFVKYGYTKKEIRKMYYEEMKKYEKNPYPHEHAARFHSPKGYIRFRRQKDKFGAGVSAIWGIKR